MTSSAQLLPIPADPPRLPGEVWGGGSRERGSMLISRLRLLPGHHTHKHSPTILSSPHAQAWGREEENLGSGLLEQDSN